MRTNSSPILYFDFSGEVSIKVARDYGARYQAFSPLLDADPEFLEWAHPDWSQMLSFSRWGRDGYTSEQLWRALMVMFIEGGSYRGTVVAIDNSEFLQYFVRLGCQPTMDFTFLCKALNVLKKTTAAALNETLARHALAEELISGDKQRMDTTACETNIHYTNGLKDATIKKLNFEHEKGNRNEFTRDMAGKISYSTLSYERPQLDLSS